MKYPNIDTDYSGIGVYIIRNKKTGRCYVGSSVNVRRRILQHRKFLTHGSGVNLKMCEDIHGKRDLKNIEVIVLYKFADNAITGQQLEAMENLAMKQFDSIANGYNVRRAYNGRYDTNKILTSNNRRNAAHDPEQIARPDSLK